jgi:hypothetical protein
VLDLHNSNNDSIAPLSLREAEHISNFIMQNENFRTFRLEMIGDEAAPIVETLSDTTVMSLHILFVETYFLMNGIRQLASPLERGTCIRELRLTCSSSIQQDQMESFQILLVESSPKMLGLKKLELATHFPVDKQFFDMLGQCIGGHPVGIEELRLVCKFSPVHSSIVGLAPALRRLKAIHFGSYVALPLHKISELSGVAADCDTLEEFGYNLFCETRQMSTEDFKATCQLLSKFPNLKRVTPHNHEVDLCEVSKFVTFLGIVKTSKTIEQVPLVQCCNAADEAAIKYYCRNNMGHNQIRENGLLTATVPSSTWPLILKKFSDMSDVLYCLLQQKHGAMIGPTRHGCKRKQHFGEGL